MKQKTAAVVLAAGKGSRMKSEIQKQYLLLSGKPVLYYSLNALENSFVDEIVLVSGKEEMEYCRKEIIEKYHFTKVKKIVAGGAERYHSVYAGLEAIAECDYVFIHDGARPFLTQAILKRALDAVKKEHACVAGMPVKDTIKLADENGYAVSTPRRDLVWMVQTPQVFDFSLVKGAYAEFLSKEQQLLSEGMKITDDAMVVETFTDTKIRLVEGSYENIKITTPEDLLIAESLLNPSIP